MDFDACIARLTGKDAKEAYALAQQIVEESKASEIWYPYFDRFAALLRHKNSLVRNRAISILAANARWDKDGKFDALLDEFLSHVTDVKPITARQCVAALPEIMEAKPELIPRIRSVLEQADLSGYADSMQPLILKDIVAVLLSLEQYAALTDDVELALDEADKAAELSDLRYSGQEVFSRVRGRIRERKAL